VYGRGQAGRAWVTGESMEEDDMVMRVGSSLSMRERDEPMRREGLQARGIYKEVPRPSRRLALATRQKIPYTLAIISVRDWILTVGDLII
jgi:hypothetical protein